MACQKVCKQGRDDIIIDTIYDIIVGTIYDIIVKVNLQSPIPTSFYITVENCIYDSIYDYIIPTLFAYLLACHPYHPFTFLMFLSLVNIEWGRH